MIRLITNTKLFSVLMEAESPILRTGLKVKNSLSGKLEEFVPTKGNSIRWYTCGPTVYSHSHLGHARNYVCNDILRRILRDYFKYDITLMMNITDIDDKIINSSIQQNIQFTEFTKKWEKDFFEDMKNLKVELPDVITRVTEFLPEIISFIKQIIKNGYAYESNGSVYFDTEKYRNKYGPGKLKRIETAQTQGAQQFSQDKKNKEDFALWKKTKKEGQPFWDSEWGHGRPGWHIECSAMASELFGQQMDVHSGGIDLIFPHHENEICQSEAFFQKPGWVRYFLHMGHLQIEGLKMSKSLKNFITIKQMLKTTTARVIRMFFAMHQYNKVLNFSLQHSLKQSSVKDKTFKDFFTLVRSHLRTINIELNQKWQQKQNKLHSFFLDKKQKIHNHFCSNFDTGSVFDEIDEIVKYVNTYVNSGNPKQLLLKSVYDYLISIFNLFGLNYETEEEKSSSDDKAVEIMNVFVKFRDNIRSNAKTDFKTILDICDQVRDYDLVDLNIKIEDTKVGKPSLWKQQKRQILIKERQDKIAAKQAALKKKQEEQQNKLNEMKVDPRQMFKSQKQYIKFDEDGIPTHTLTKKKVELQIPEKTRVALRKKWTEQKQKFDKYQQSLNEKVDK